MHRTKKQITCLSLSLLILVSLSPSRALAWGGGGHRIIAQLALRQLTREAKTDPVARRARNMVYKTLATGSTTLEAAAVWPDVVRGSADYLYADNWHFVSIPRAETAYNAATQCKKKTTSPEGDCAVGGLMHFRKVLLDNGRSKAERLDALRFIIHFVGDLHQPLHTSEDLDFIHDGKPGDRGGNYRPVCFLKVSNAACTEVYDGERKSKNLHATWDKYMIIQTGTSELDYIDHLDGRIAGMSAATLAGYLNSGPAEWAEEAHALAVQAAYTPVLLKDSSVPHAHAFDEFFFIDQSYQSANIARVDEQLVKAGIRLAAYLKQIAREAH